MAYMRWDERMRADGLEHHELVGRIRRAKAQGEAGKRRLAGYGFVLYAMTMPDGERVIAVATESGESMPFTRRLLKALDGMSLWVAGQAPGVIEEARMRAFEDEPIPAISVGIALAPGALDMTDFLEMTSTFEPEDLTVNRIVIVTPRRPAGWPA